jgi:hypothetical protein
MDMDAVVSETSFSSNLPNLRSNWPALVQWEGQGNPINEDDRISWVVNFVSPSKGYDREVLMCDVY